MLGPGRYVFRPPYGVLTDDNVNSFYRDECSLAMLGEENYEKNLLLDTLFILVLPLY